MGNFPRTLQRQQMPDSTPQESGMAQGFQQTDAQALAAAQQRLKSLVGQQAPAPIDPNIPSPTGGIGMNYNDGNSYDQAHANLAAKYGNTAAVPQNYEQKAAALQQVIDNSNSQGAIQGAKAQLDQLKANKPQTLNVDDLEDIN